MGQSGAIDTGSPPESTPPHAARGTSTSRETPGGESLPPLRITMHVGETRTFTFPPTSDLRVSRRGTVDLYHRGQGVWDLTALKSGLVAVDTFLPETQETAGRRTYIEVTAFVPLANDTPHNLGRYFFCQTKGIKCDDARRSISGITDSEALYRDAAKVCRETASCHLSLILSAKGGEKLKATFAKALGSRYQLLPSPQFPWLVRGSCSATSLAKEREEINIRTDQALEHGLLVMHCLGEEAEAGFYLHMTVVLAESQAAESRGGNSVAEVGFHLDAAAALLDANIRSVLSDVARHQHVRVIGEPVTHIVPGKTLEIDSGGEFAAHAKGKERSQEWKSHGLSIKAKLTPQPSAAYRLSLSAALRLRSHEGGNHLSLQSLTSDIDLITDVPALIGTIDLEAEEEGADSLPMISHLPFIGPFFRTHATVRTHAQLILITRISKSYERHTQEKTVKNQIENDTPEAGE